MSEFGFAYYNVSADFASFSVSFPWRSVALVLYFLLLADAKERELMLLRKLPSPTWVRFVWYPVWLAVTLLASEEMSGKTPLYDLGVVFLTLSWTTCWGWHMSQTSTLFAALAFGCAVIEAIAFPRPELILWTAFLAFHLIATARFHHLRQHVPIPKRPISRFTSPSGEMPPTTYIVMQETLPILISQKEDV